MDTREPKSAPLTDRREADRDRLDPRPHPSATRLLETQTHRRVERVMQAARQLRLR